MSLALNNKQEQRELFLRKETIISNNYLSDWTILHACKEFAQNYVYALQTLGQNGNHYYDKQTGIAIWEDYGKGFGLEMLLIGNSQQRQDNNSPGENGEGMKLSLKVASQCGKYAQISIPGYDIEAKFEIGSLGSEELVLYIYRNNRMAGCRFTLECSEEEFNQANACFGFISASNNDKYLFTKNSILKDTNKIYINGVEIDLKLKCLYGYNLVGKRLSNRDRNAVNMWTINNHVWQYILSETTDKEVIKSVLSNINESCMETYDSYCFNTKNIKIWQAVAKELWGSKVCYASNSPADVQVLYRHYNLLDKL